MLHILPWKVINFVERRQASEYIGLRVVAHPEKIEVRSLGGYLWKHEYVFCNLVLKRMHSFLFFREYRATH